MSSQRKKKATTYKQKGGRLHIRVSRPEFAEEVHAYARRHNTNVSLLVVHYLQTLLSEEATLLHDAEQI